MDHQSGNDIISKEESVEIINKRLRYENLKNYTFDKYELIKLQESVGLLGQYYTLRITVSSSSCSSEKKTFDFFVKCPPIGGTPADAWNEEYGYFMKELQIYTKMFPAIIGDTLDSITPKCFLGVENKAIVLEDMTVSGYKMAKKSEPLDLAHCRIVMKTMARFHARCFIYEEVTKKIINEEFSACTHEILFPMHGILGPKSHKSEVKGITSLIGLLDNFDEVKKSKLKDKIRNLTEYRREAHQPWKTLRNVLTHGDLHASNLLFKYDDQGKPARCCMIDFQHARYHPPAYDVLYFLQATSSKEFREQHKSELIKLYYDTLSADLVAAHLNPENVFSFKNLLDSLDKIYVPVLVNGMFNIPLMLVDSEAAAHHVTEGQHDGHFTMFVDRSVLFCEQYKKVEGYRKRINEMFLEFYDEFVH